MNRNEKMKYIQDELQNINHHYIIKYIYENNIKYTENNNGIFINLSIMDDEIFDMLYTNINEKSFNINDIQRDELLLNYTNISIEKTNEKIKIKYKIPENLSDVDLQIIEYSKTI